MQTLKVACRQGASPLRTQAAWIQLSCMSTLDKFTCIIKSAATRISSTYTSRRIPLSSQIKKQGLAVYYLKPISSNALINFSCQSLAAYLRLQRLRSTRSTFPRRQSTPSGAAIKIFFFRTDSVKALFISTWWHSMFLTATIARKRRRESNLTVGANVCSKSIPWTCENPRTTSLALNLSSELSKQFLTLNIYLLVTILASFGGKIVSYIPFNISAIISIVIAFFYLLLYIGWLTACLYISGVGIAPGRS